MLESADNSNIVYSLVRLPVEMRSRLAAGN